MKLRYADEAVKEIKQIDPSSAVTARMIRSLIKKQVIPSIPVGNGCRKLIDLDVLMDYLSDPTKYVINMPRSPYRRNKVPFPPWFTKIETGMERKYIRIGETMIKSEAWNTLPSSTTKLLLCMMYVANGKQHFQFPCHLAVQCGFSRSSFWRYRDELIAYGFIEVVANNKLQRRNNVYGFCSKWKEFSDKN